MRLPALVAVACASLSLFAACGGADPAPAGPAKPPEASGERRHDTLATSQGDLTITPIHHATVMFQFQGKTIYVDPWSDGDLSGLPKGDGVFITDIHPDHTSTRRRSSLLVGPATVVVGPPAVGAKTKLSVTLPNGESKQVGPVGAVAVPMYNLVRGPEAGKFFHDKGRGDGYVLTFGDKRVYLSGDTECTPEMKALKNIDVAFVCMNLPYTMPPEEAATCIQAFRPKIVIPYHYKGQEPRRPPARARRQQGHRASTPQLLLTPATRIVVRDRLALAVILGALGCGGAGADASRTPLAHRARRRRGGVRGPSPSARARPPRRRGEARSRGAGRRAKSRRALRADGAALVGRA